MVTYTLKVSAIRAETSDTITLCFKQPALRKIKYKAGQYLSLIFRINGRRYVRPYSFSSAPSVDSMLELTIKRVPNGVVSNHIHDQVRIGDAIEVLEPLGDFIFQEGDEGGSVFFWGAGSGVTPLISLVKDILNKGTMKVYLIYGNRNFETTIFLDTINLLVAKYPKNFEVWHFHTQVELSMPNAYLVEGRIDGSYVLDILNGTEFSSSRHYICGPEGLKTSVIEVLHTSGVSDEKIYSEDFQLIKNPEDFTDIITRIIKLRFQNSDYSLEVTKGKSILESALDAGLDLPYSCQTGNCNTCKARRLEGQVKMIGLSKERLDLGRDEYLVCCSHPLSNDVYLEM